MDLFMHEFIKKCPKCNGIQEYSSYDSLRIAKRRNTFCNPCRAAVKKIIPENGVWKRRCNCGNEMIYSCRRSYNTGRRTNSICRECAVKLSHKSDPREFFNTYDYRKKMSNALKKVRCTASYGEEFKKKCRLNKARWIKLNVGPKYNKKACQFIDELNNKMNWNLRHAENGGEKEIEGFFVDGYDDVRNIIFEYDEPKHHTLSQEKKDRIKEKVIIEKIHPSKFIRYSERYKTIYDVVNKEYLCQ